MTGRYFVPDPPPFGTDPVLAEWLIRQLRRIDLSTTEIIKLQDDGGGELGDVRVDLDAHIQNQADPHNVQHSQLADVAGNLTHPQLDAHVQSQADPHNVQHSQLGDVASNLTHPQLDAHVQSQDNPHAVQHSQLADVAGNLTHAQIDTDLVRKAGDTMTGNLVLDGTASETDLILKGDPLDLAAPVNGAALLLHDSNDVSLGGIAAATTDPADPDKVAFVVGSLDDTLSVLLVGAAAIIDPANIAIGTPGAQVGSRLICSGFTTSGLPILAWEDPPPSAYNPSCSNATDFLIRLGVGTGPWVEVCVITTTQQIEASQNVTIFWSMHLDNRSSRTGTFEVAFTVDGAVPSGPAGSPIIVSSGMDEIVSGSTAYPGGTVYPVGTTFEYHVRATGDHSQFNLWSLGTATPATMDLQVR